MTISLAVRYSSKFAFLSKSWTLSDDFSSTISKSFELGRAVITFPPKNEMAKKDLEYLAQNNLIYAAKDSKDIIIGLYKLLQTELEAKLLANAKDRLIENNVESIAEYLMNFGKSKEAAEDNKKEIIEKVIVENRLINS